VDALGLIFRAELRRRWRSWLALAVLIAVVGGVVIASAAAGRRTASAFPSFVRTHGYDFVVFNGSPLPQLARYPAVASITTAPDAYNGQPACACAHTIDNNNFNVMYVPPKDMSRTINLVAGSMPDSSSPDEVLASFNLERDNGVHVGTVLRMRMYAASQSEAVNQATGAGPPPTGPFISFHVVGIEAAVDEFQAGTTPLYDIYTTPAFARSVLPKTTSGFVYLVKLRHGAADVDAFKTYAKSLGIGAFTDLSTPEVLLAGSIHPQAVGWWLLAALAALAGGAVVGQALSRTRRVESDEFPIFKALGLGRSELVALGMASTLLVALVGAVGALAFAYALSPLAPVGDARLAEPSTGLRFDGPVLLLGALATVVVVLALGMWPTLRAARGRVDAVRPRQSAVVRFVSAAGAPPTMVVGVRNALERGRGAASAPVATALLGAALAVAALCGTTIFASSLAHLDSTPSLFGDTYQVIIYGTPSTSSSASPEADQRQVIRGLERHKGIDRITVATGAPISIDGVTVQGAAYAAVLGPPLLVAIDGRLPARPGEIALGSSSMRLVGTHAGAVVPVRFTSPTGHARTFAFRVVGTAALPTGVGDGEVGLGTGALLTLGGYEQAACPHGPANKKCVGSILANTAVLASATQSGSGHVAIEHIISSGQNYVGTPFTPTTLVNFGEAVDFPLILGLILAIFGAATLTHLLVVSVGRRRREMGLLKAVGFVSRQVGATVYWQATTVTLVGLVVGVPVGIALGRVIWRAFALNVGVVPDAVVDLWVIVGLGAAVLVGALLLAIGPALAAARARPARLLRVE
jgi:FtsX-like permease family